MAEFTLLKLEFPDANLTANAPFGGSEEPTVESEDEDDEQSTSVLPLVIGLAFLVAMAVAAKKVLGSDEELTGDEVVAGEEPLAAADEA